MGLAPCHPTPIPQVFPCFPLKGKGTLEAEQKELLRSSMGHFLTQYN